MENTEYYVEGFYYGSEKELDEAGFYVYPEKGLKRRESRDAQKANSIPQLYFSEN
jgi:hypothetical protein